MGGPASPAPEGTRSPVPLSRARSWASVLGLAGVSIALAQSANLLGAYVPPDVGYALLVAVPAGLLGLLWLVVRWEGRSLREYGFAVRGPLGVTLAFASLLVFLFTALRIDPGFFFGFGRIFPLPPPLFGFFLLSAPLVALAPIAVLIGYGFRTLARLVPLRWAIGLTSVFYALYSTDIPAYRFLGAVGSGQYLFTTSVAAFVLGLLLALYSYKSQWSLLGPVAVGAALLATSELLPVGVRYPDWGTSFAATMIAYGVLLLTVGVGLQEPRLQALKYLRTRIGPRRLRFRQQARDRKALGGTVAGAAAVGVAVLSITFVLPATLGTATPFLAIATGSMVPTFHRGEFVVIQHVPPTEIHVGTIIAFSVSCLPSPTVHRVIKIVSGAPNWVFQTKGDHNPAQDPCTVPYSHVLGRAIFYVPDLGYLILDPLLTASILAMVIIVPWAFRGAKG